MTDTLANVYRQSTKFYSSLPCSRMEGSELSYTFSSFRKHCDSLSAILSNLGIGAGDAVAIYSTGTPNWAVAFFAATAFGRVAVPMLPDFSGPEALNILEHSESKVLFTNDRLLGKIKLGGELPATLQVIIDIDTLEIHWQRNGKALRAKVNENPGANDLAAIIYTSGTTSSSKGVMLTHRNFTANIEEARDFFPIGPEDVMLSILPLAHTYELSLGMLYPFASGASVCYISKAPTPTYLMNVMQEVQPTAMLTVPLIIEKVYKGTILPMINHSPMLAWMDKHMHKLLCRIIGKRMVNSFGGRLRFFGIGGAKLDVDVERFLKEARFPYYMGYGLTECAPLLAVCCWYDKEPGQIGVPAKGVELRIDNINPETGEGELVARGENIMPGYFKDEERTASAFTEDGWFRTSDIVCRDAEGRYAIKGRLGNMILGASGENIYPEEIEKVVKEIPQVDDVIVICRGHALVCLVRCTDTLFDLAKASTDTEVAEAVAKFKSLVLEYVNARVSSSSRLNSVELMTEPFQKTATLKIRRFLYQSNAPTV